MCFVSGCPTPLSAEHWYCPAECLSACCITKDRPDTERSPLGKTLFFLVHATVGTGFPDARHSILTVAPCNTSKGPLWDT